MCRRRHDLRHRPFPARRSLSCADAPRRRRGPWPPSGSLSRTRVGAPLARNCPLGHGVISLRQLAGELRFISTLMKSTSLLALLALCPAFASAALDSTKIEAATGLKGTLSEAEGVFKV